MTSYLIIYERFLSKVTDYKLLELPLDDVHEMMHDWMLSSISVPYISKLFKSISINDDSMQLDFQLKNSNSDELELDINFVIDVLASAMVVEWIKPQVESTLNIMQMYSGKEEKFYSQANHIEQLRGLLEDARSELRKLIRDRGYISNSYINGE